MSGARAVRVAAAARALVGTRFRLHGRDPAHGLDCVGVAALALKGAGCEAAVPVGYALRSGDAERVRAGAAAAGLVPVDDWAPGTLALVRAGPGQLHLLVTTAAGFVHADAGLKRVVERPGAVPWRVIARWRLSEEG